MLGTSQQQPNPSAPPAVYCEILHGKSLEEHQLRGKEELEEQRKGVFSRSHMSLSLMLIRAYSDGSRGKTRFYSTSAFGSRQ
jgi:hypothetical protein